MGVQVKILIEPDLEKDPSTMPKYTKRIPLLFNLLVVSEGLLPSFTGIIKHNNTNFEIIKSVFDLFVDTFRYLNNLAPIKDKTELWRCKKSPFYFYPTEENTVKIELKCKVDIVYADLHLPEKYNFSPTPRDKIESMLLAVQNCPETKRKLQTKFAQYLKNVRNAKRKHPKEVYSPNKRQRCTASKLVNVHEIHSQPYFISQPPFVPQSAYLLFPPLYQPPMTLSYLPYYGARPPYLLKSTPPPTQLPPQ